MFTIDEVNVCLWKITDSTITIIKLRFDHRQLEEYIREPRDEIPIRDVHSVQSLEIVVDGEEISVVKRARYEFGKCIESIGPFPTSPSKRRWPVEFPSFESSRGKTRTREFTTDVDRYSPHHVPPLCTFEGRVANTSISLKGGDEFREKDATTRHGWDASASFEWSTPTKRRDERYEKPLLGVALAWTLPWIQPVIHAALWFPPLFVRIPLTLLVSSGGQRNVANRCFCSKTQRYRVGSQSMSNAQFLHL